MLSGVSFELLGFDKDIAQSALPDLTWTYIAKIPAVIAVVSIGGSAVWAVTHRKGMGE